MNTRVVLGYQADLRIIRKNKVGKKRSSMYPFSCRYQEVIRLSGDLKEYKKKLKRYEVLIHHPPIPRVMPDPGRICYIEEKTK